MSNLRIKNKKLKREIEKLKAQQVGVINRTIFPNREAFPATLRAEISFDRYEYSRMIDDNFFDAKDMIRRELVYMMTDDLLKHVSINGCRDEISDRVIFRGALSVINVVKEG